MFLNLVKKKKKKLQKLTLHLFTSFLYSENRCFKNCNLLFSIKLNSVIFFSTVLLLFLLFFVHQANSKYFNRVVVPKKKVYLNLMSFSKSQGKKQESGAGQYSKRQRLNWKKNNIHCEIINHNDSSNSKKWQTNNPATRNNSQPEYDMESQACEKVMHDRMLFLLGNLVVRSKLKEEVKWKKKELMSFF